jgi:hypothetical protein
MWGGNVGVHFLEHPVYDSFVAKISFLSSAALTEPIATGITR